MRLDLPTLERPAKAISGRSAGGRNSSAGALFKSCQRRSKRRSPAASMVLSTSVIFAAFGVRELLALFLAVAPSLYRVGAAPGHRGNRFELAREIAHEVNVRPLPAHDVVLLRQGQRVAPRPVDHEAGRERREQE